MHVIFWEFQVRSIYLSSFKGFYGEEGVWVELLRRGQGYQGTKLYRDTQKEARFIVVDSWNLEGDYQVFRTSFEDEYKALDQKCEALFEKETLIGYFSTTE